MAKAAKPIVRSAVLVGKEAPTRTPRGHFVFKVGKTFALQETATNEVTTLPGKLNAAVKELLTTGGIVTKATAKAAGLDFAELVAKLDGKPKANVVAKATSLVVTPHAAKANLKLADAPAAKPAKATKGAKQAPAATPAKGKAAKPAVAAPKAARKAADVPAKATKATKVEAPKAKKAKAVEATAPKATKGKPAKAEATKQSKAKADKSGKVVDFNKAKAKLAKGKEAKAAKADAPKAKKAK